MGRAGRVTATGQRAQTLLYILYNSQVVFKSLHFVLRYIEPQLQDLGNNVKGMSDGVRRLCLSKDTCLRSLLKESFEGKYAACDPLPYGFCCTVCDGLPQRRL